MKLISTFFSILVLLPIVLHNGLIVSAHEKNSVKIEEGSTIEHPIYGQYKDPEIILVDEDQVVVSYTDNGVRYKSIETVSRLSSDKYHFSIQISEEETSEVIKVVDQVIDYTSGEFYEERDNGTSIQTYSEKFDVEALSEKVELEEQFLEAYLPEIEYSPNNVYIDPGEGGNTPWWYENTVYRSNRFQRWALSAVINGLALLIGIKLPIAGGGVALAASEIVDHRIPVAYARIRIYTRNVWTNNQQYRQRTWLYSDSRRSNLIGPSSRYPIVTYSD